MAKEYIEKEAALNSVRLNEPNITNILASIVCIPAANVRENVKGEWLRTPTAWFYCSVCGEEPPDETNARTRFCPNCGADMTGGNDA